MIASPSEHTPADVLKLALLRLMRRLNLQRLEFCLMRVFSVSLFLVAALLFFHKTYLINSPIWLPLGIVLLSAGLAIEWWRRKRVNLFETALEADRRLGLKEKLSSGVAFSDPLLVRRKVRRTFDVRADKARHPLLQRAVPIWQKALNIASVLLPPRDFVPSWAQREGRSELVPALVSDAAQHAQKVKPGDVLPWRRDWRLYSIAFFEVAALAFLLMWGGKDLRPPDKRAVGKALAIEGKRLEDVAKEHKELAKNEKMSEAKKAALELAKLGREMQDKRMPKKDALLKMDELGKEMEKLQDQAAQKEEGREVTNLQKLADALKEEEMADQNAQEMAKQLAQQNLADAQNALQQMMQELQSGKMSEQQKQQLAKELEAMAKGLDKAGSKELAKQLQKLAQSIKSGQMANMKMNAKDLANLMKNLQLSKEQMEALQQMAENLKMSSMSVSQSDQPCEICQGSGKG